MEKIASKEENKSKKNIYIYIERKDKLYKINTHQQYQEMCKHIQTTRGLEQMCIHHFKRYFFKISF